MMQIKYITLVIILLVPITVYSKSSHKISRPVTDTISIDDADQYKDRLVLNVENDSYQYQSTEYLAPMATYSTKGWDVGLSSQNIVLSSKVPAGSSTAQNFQNDTYLNVSKTIRYGDLLDNISPVWSDRLDFISTTFGSQTGTIFPMSNSVDPGNLNSKTIHLFEFIDNDFELIKNRFTVHAGPYWTNAALSTTTSYGGWQAGTEIIVFPKTLRLQVDTFSGHSNVSGTVVQATYMFNKHVELFAGFGLPALNSSNYQYGILGFNLIYIFEVIK